jgi:tetratricopeptide (TPR) repeat protein/Mrp family chromosome partitioning ATPase
MSVTRSDRRIVTFYSFKGGVGRSMALANVAFRLADRHDLRVIVVDWDLEAPGLHRFFGISDEVAATKGGLLEYLLAWREAVEEDAESPPDATGWLIPVTSPKPAHGSLSLLLAGQLDEGFPDRLRGFDWRPFYRFNAGAAAIETLRKQLAGQADMVLVDSRTGVTDAGGVCTVQMPDGVVLMTAANDQSFAGIERVGRAIAAGEGERAGRAPIKVWVAVGRAPYLDVPKHGEDWFNEYGRRLEAGYEAGLWAKVDHPRGLRSHRLPHVGRWGFGEQILDARLETDDPLAIAYGALSDQLIQWAMGQEEQARTQDKGRVRTVEELKHDVQEAEQRGDFARLSGALSELADALSNKGELTSAAEMFQKAAGIQLARDQRLEYALTLLLLGGVRRKQERFDEAKTELERARAIFHEMDFRSGESLALGAIASSFLSDTPKDPDKAEELYKRAVGIDPTDANNLGDYANFISNVRKDADAAEELYKRAIEADPKHANNLGNYAAFLSNVRKDADAAEELFKRAIEADPRHAHSLGNYAGMLLAIGRHTDGLLMLDRALDAPDIQVDARVECWFYAFAHRPSERRGEALTHLKRLIVGEGARSPGWDLSGNVERARSDGHSDAAWLALLADVISEKADPALLDAWPAWAAA